MLNRNELSRLQKRLNRSMKDFLFSDRSREFFLFLFFFFVAGGFWLLQTLNGEFEDDLQVPLRLKGIPHDVVITSELPQHVQLRIKDRGTVLLNYKVGKDFLPLNIDFDKVRAMTTMSVCPLRSWRSNCSRSSMPPHACSRSSPIPSISTIPGPSPNGCR